ncbi:polysaccharide deacetylase family protein [Chloroflexota bacterium]
MEDRSRDIFIDGGNMKATEVAIIVYHRVLQGQEGSSFDGGIPWPTPEVFEKQIRYLREKYNIISFEDFMQYIQKGKELPKNSVIITFDDGYKDNYANAYPILKRYSIPATIFLATGYIGSSALHWSHKIAYAIRKTMLPDLEVADVGRYSLNSVDERLKAISDIKRKLKKMSEQEKNLRVQKIIDVLEVELPEELGKDLFLSWDDVRDMHNSGITFGSHTVTHSILTRISREEARKEITESKRRIEEELGEPVNLFSYPEGTRDCFDDEIKELLKENGFFCAVSASPGTNKLDTDLYELRRIGPISNGINVLKLKIGGPARYLRAALTSKI